MTSGPDLPCNELVELVTEYLDSALDDGARDRFEAHLTGCPGCRRYLDQIRTTVDLLARTPTWELSPAARESVLQAFREHGPGPVPAAGRGSAAASARRPDPTWPRNGGEPPGTGRA